MRRLDHVLSRVAERGDPLGADLLIDHLERKLAGEPDPIVVRRRSGIMQTFKEETARQPGPPTRRRGLTVALASFIALLMVGGGILLWNAIDDNGGGETAAPATTPQAPSTTQAPSAVAGEAVGTFTFDGTTWTYDGPSTLEAGSVTFSLVNTSSEQVGVFSWFGLEGEEFDAELAVVPVGTDIGAPSDDPPAPPSDFMALLRAAPGETASATTVMGAGTHVIDCATLASAWNATHVWRVAALEVTEPASLPAGEAVGTFTFDGSTWSYDGPSTLEAGFITFSLVNTSSEDVAVVSWRGLSGEELDAELAVAAIGSDFDSGNPPPPPSDFMFLVRAAPGESVSATTVMGAGDHLIDGGTMMGGSGDHIWRLALLKVVQP